MIQLEKSTREQLLELYRKRRVVLEGNILKLIDAENDIEFANYITDSIEKDKATRRKRLEITKQVQSQNGDLTRWKEENEKIQAELKTSLDETQLAKNEADRAREEAITAKIEADTARDFAENAKVAAETDLDLLQKKSQFELMGRIVRVALFVIIGVGVTTTGMYLTALFIGRDTQIIGSTWSNMFGILLTNSFSVVGTIMGVKYASEKISS